MLKHNPTCSQVLFSSRILSQGYLAALGEPAMIGQLRPNRNCSQPLCSSRLLLQGYLAALGEPAVTEQLARRAKEATNMTDEISALVALDRAGEAAGSACSQRAAVLRSFTLSACQTQRASQPLPPMPALDIWRHKPRRFPAAGGQLGASPGCVAARKAALEGFFDKWQSEPLVLLKWFTLQVRLDVSSLARAASCNPA